MPRSSWGTGVFSPIRYDLSFNDSLFSDGSPGSGRIDGLGIPGSSEPKENSMKAKLEANATSGEKERKRSPYKLRSCANNLFGISQSKSHGGEPSGTVTEKKLSIPKSRNMEIGPSAAQTKLLVFSKDEETEKERLLNLDITVKDHNANSSECRSSYSSTNSSSSTRSSRKNKKGKLNFVTVRNDQGKGIEQRTIFKKTTVNLLPTHQEHSEQSYLDHFMIEKTRNGKYFNSATNMHSTNGKHFSLTTGMQDSADHAAMDKKTIDVHLGSSVKLTNQPTNIQADVIEKIITSTVSFEFDAIRQQMYHQTLTLCKAINQRMGEFEEQKVRQNLELCKIIEDLMEENKALRNALIARH